MILVILLLAFLLIGVIVRGWRGLIAAAALFFGICGVFYLSGDTGQDILAVGLYAGILF